MMLMIYVFHNVKYQAEIMGEKSRINGIPSDHYFMGKRASFHGSPGSASISGGWKAIRDWSMTV